MKNTLFKNKRICSILVILISVLMSLFVILFASGFTAYAANDSQVDYAGSETWQTGEGNLGFRQLMTQTKDALGNDIENTFDVELGIRTKTDLSYKNIHICLVLDLSRTMLTEVGTGAEKTTRLDALTVAAHDLIQKYVEQSKDVPLPEEEGGVKRSLTIIGFNTSAHVLLSTTDVRKVDEDSIYDEFWNKLTTAVEGYATYNSSIDKFEDTSTGYCSPERFTNCESGLRAAQYYVDKDLSGLQNVSKNVLFLSDGLPTTYSVVADHSSAPSDCDSEQSYDMKGFYNYMSDGSEQGIKLNPDWSKECWYLGGRKQNTLTVGQDGYFANRKKSDLACSSGVSYSDKSSQYAQERAKAMKQAGYKIYSVGIGISAQTLPSAMGNSIVDCYSNDFHGRTYVTCNDIAEFRSWLGGSDSRTGYDSPYGIGSSGSVQQSYWDVEDSAGKEKLVEAFNSILKSMVFLTEAWKSNIEIGTNDTSSFSDFISLYQHNASTGAWELTSNPNISIAKYEANKQGLNSAKFNKKINGDQTNAGTLTWDLSNSGYALEDDYYVYKLKYRIRINNQKTGFQAWDSTNSVKTNEIISVKYQVYDQYEQIDPEIKTLNQNTDTIPRFHAFKGNSDTFIKMDLVTRERLSNITFKLVHKHDATQTTLQDHYCEKCFINKTAAGDNAEYCSATTSSEEGHKGEIVFKDIPSGHDYQLVEDETTIPEGYSFPYDIVVKVSFGVVKFYEKNGATLREINGEIYNNPTGIQKIYAPGTDVTSEQTMVAPDVAGLSDHIQYIVFWQNNVDASTDDTVVVTDVLSKGLIFDSQVNPDSPTPMVSKDESTGITTLTWTIDNTKYLDSGMFNYKCKVTQDSYNQKLVTNTAFQKVSDNPQEFIGTLSNPVPDKQFTPKVQTGDITLIILVTLIATVFFALTIFSEESLRN